MPPNYMTRRTYDRLMEKARIIKEVEIPRLSREKLDASRHGDLSENAEYTSAKEALEMLQVRLGRIREQLTGAQFIDDLPVTGEVVSLGTRVRLLDRDRCEQVEYCILGPADADAEKGIISYQSPLAKGMISRKKGEEIAVDTPSGKRSFTILSIEKYCP